MELSRFAVDGGSPVEIGNVPPVPPEAFVSILDDSTAPAYGPYRELYRSIRRRFKGRSVVAFSPAAGVEQSGLVLVDLAFMIGSTGLSVLLVDADLDSPHLHEALNLPNDEGLVDMVLHGSSFDRVAAETGRPGVRFIPAGSVAPDPDEVFQAGRFVPVARTWTERAEVVLLAVPPVDRLGNQARLAPYLKGLILLVPEGESPDRAMAALEDWPSLTDKLKGFVTVGAAEESHAAPAAVAVIKEEETPPSETSEPGGFEKLNRGGESSMGDKEKDFEGAEPSEEELEAELEAELEKLSLEDEITEQGITGEEPGDLEIGTAGEELEIDAGGGTTFEGEDLEEEIPEELELEDALPRDEAEEPAEGEEAEELTVDDLATGLEEELETIEKEESRQAPSEAEEPLELEPEDEPLDLETGEEPEPAFAEALDAELEAMDEGELTGDLGISALQEEPEVEEPEEPREEEEGIVFPTDEQLGLTEGSIGEGPEAAVGEEELEAAGDLSFLENLDSEEKESAPVFHAEEEEEEMESRRTSPLVLVAGLVVLLAGVGYLWWSGLYRNLPLIGSFFGGGGAEQILVEEMPLPAAEIPVEPSAPQPEVSVIPTPPAAVGPTLDVSGSLFPYAVHTSSFKRLWLANREVVRLNRAGFNAFRSYTDVPGKGWFHRVYVADARTAADGRALANRMKSGRVTDFAETRNVPYGCVLDVFADRAAAQRRIDELREMGYSPYLEQGRDGRFRLYVGAYATARECGVLAAQLDDDNIPYRIVER